MATSLHGWQLNPISLSPLACLLAWRVPTGSQRVPKGLQKGTPKWPKIDQKSTRAALGMPKGVRGYPPGASEAPNMHFYAYLCIYLQYFVHIYAYFAHIYACVHWFPAYLCILLYTSPIFMHIYAYSDIFINVYVYLMHICIHLCSLSFSVHIYTYSFMRRRWSAGNEKSCSRATLHRDLKYLQVHST